MNEEFKEWNSINWDSISKAEYWFRDRSVHPDYHRSYTITITNNEKTIEIYSYISKVLTRSYPNNQEDFDIFKEALARTGIYSHEIISDCRTGITSLGLKLYDDNKCVYSGYTTNAEGKYGDMYIPEDSVRLFHDEIPESVGEMIHTTIVEVVRHREATKERERQEKEAKEKVDIDFSEKKYRSIFEALSHDMVYVEGGSFKMGSDDIDAHDNEKPVHKVTLSSYYICRYQVTQELWFAVMDNNPSNYKSERRPVEQVSWNDCQKFIQKLNMITGKNYRLPTEAEWEFAARGGNRSQGYKYAGSNYIKDVAWCSNSKAWYNKVINNDRTHRVGKKHPNELGLYDMSGNVWEWCQDRYGTYSNSEQFNPMGDDNGSNLVYRGGGFDNSDNDCRVSRRNRFRSTYKYVNLGLRLAI